MPEKHKINFFCPIFIYFQDELIDSVVLPHLSSIEADLDLEVRSRSGELLVELVKTCNSSRCMELLHVLTKVCLILNNFILSMSTLLWYFNLNRSKITLTITLPLLFSLFSYHI